MTAAKVDDVRERIQARFFWAVFLLYLAFRLLGATKAHAWDRARVAVAEAVLDKVVEQTGILDPRKKGLLQVTFEGGARDREIAHFADHRLAVINIEGPDHTTLHYRRTSRKRGNSVIFKIEGDR